MRKMIFVAMMVMTMGIMTGCGGNSDNDQITDNTHVFTLDDSGVTVYMNEAEVKPIETEAIEVETIETETIEEGHKFINKGE